MIYLASILGSLLFILIRFKIEKQKKDDNPKYHFRLKKYFKKEWDDWGLSIAVGLILTFFEEQIYFGYVIWKGLEMGQMKGMYEYVDLLIAGGFGLFGSLLIMILFKYVIKKAGKLTE